MAEEEVQESGDSRRGRHKRRKRRRRNSGKDFDVARDNFTVFMVVLVVFALGFLLLWALIPFVSHLYRQFFF